MAVHDAYLRRTPYELTFPDPRTADDLVAAVISEAQEAGVDPADRRSFVVLGAVGAFLRRLQPEGRRPEAMYDYAMLLYHAFRFARTGARPLLVTETTARALVDEGERVGSVEAPAPAGYAQLPRNLFWIQPTPTDVAEPVDGLFWSLGEEGLLHILVVAGMRDDRPGLVVVPVPEAPWGDAPSWLEARIRPEGKDFATTLPGGELDVLYSFLAAGEVLKLTARLFARVQARPDTVAEGISGSTQEERVGPIPSALPYQRI
ncbi:MAG: hypothetical protein LJF04_00525 [Gemmatimonadetes bacterium]|nr:hypothetical protein [Gemmatimonadota bacterium]